MEMMIPMGLELWGLIRNCMYTYHYALCLRALFEVCVYLCWRQDCQVATCVTNISLVTSITTAIICIPTLVIAPESPEAPERITSYFNVTYSPFFLDKLPLSLVVEAWILPNLSPCQCTECQESSQRLGQPILLPSTSSNTTHFFEILISSVSYFTVLSL